MTAARLTYWHGLAFAVLSDRDEAIAEFVAQKRAAQTRRI